jgi:hypothetical protein
MTVINIVKSALSSQLARELIGERVIDIFTALSTEEVEGDEEGGIIQTIWGIGKKLVGFVINAAKAIVGWLLRNGWEILIQLTYELVNFDWNQTDAAIRQQMQSNNERIAMSLGAFAGTGLVWVASIAIAGLATIKFPVLAGKIALDLAREGGEEIRGQLNSLLYSTRDAVASNIVLGGLLTLRQLRLFGLVPITQEKEPWTIAGEIEERIERIDNGMIRAFVRGFLESAVDAIIEVGYVVSYSIDDYYEAVKLANQSQLGEQRSVILQPDTRVEENVIITGPQELVKQNIQTAITTHRLIYNRDVGAIVGQPAEDWVRGGIQRRKLVIVFKSRKEPPWRVTGESTKEISYTIPEPKTGLSWQELKTAAKHWTWGRFRATANLENGRQMAVYGATKEEAEEKLRELKTLTSLEILTLSVSEERDRHPNLRKSPTRMYPAYATLLIRRSTAQNSGVTDLSGRNYREENFRIELWPDSQPEGVTPLL